MGKGATEPVLYFLLLLQAGLTLRTHQIENVPPAVFLVGSQLSTYCLVQKMIVHTSYKRRRVFLHGVTRRRRSQAYNLLRMHTVRRRYTNQEEN